MIVFKMVSELWTLECYRDHEDYMNHVDNFDNFTCTW